MSREWHNLYKNTVIETSKVCFLPVTLQKLKCQFLQKVLAVEKFKHDTFKNVVVFKEEDKC